MKKIIGFVSIFIVIVVVFSSIVAVLNSKKSHDTDQANEIGYPGLGTIGEAMLTAKTMDEFLTLAEEEKSIEVFDDIDVYEAIGVPLYDKTFSISHKIDEKGDVKHTVANADIINLEETQVDVSKFATECRTIVSKFMCLFNVNAEVPFHIFDKNGNGKSDYTDEDFGAILNNGSYLSLEVRENEGSYWILTIRKIDESFVDCKIEHLTDIEITKDLFGDVNLDL